ncbi:hypothetical protein V6N12_024240 [Hibiscus sabdariffa]|uniref:Uncharacterized protein n=1 Tax=Hibiscus sabdariffa TaxID=183260 RepID=A0ABR2FZZ7_9ROSI
MSLALRTQLGGNKAFRPNSIASNHVRDDDPEPTSFKKVARHLPSPSLSIPHIPPFKPFSTMVPSRFNFKNPRGGAFHDDLERVLDLKNNLSAMGRSATTFSMDTPAL